MLQLFVVVIHQGQLAYSAQITKCYYTPLKSSIFLCDDYIHIGVMISEHPVWDNISCYWMSVPAVEWQAAWNFSCLESYVGLDFTARCYDNRCILNQLQRSY